MSGLQLRDVAFLRGATPILDGVNLQAPAGAFTTLLGPSGAGKTTVLRVVAGLLAPTRGEVLLDGAAIHGLPPERRGVGLAFAGGALFPHLSALDNVRFPLQAAGIGGASAARATAALAILGVADLAPRKPSELSGGERQRVALARALAQEPRVLLLDEPLAGLDPRLRRSLREEIRALQRRLGLTVVMVTHDQREALAVSDHVVLLHRGRVVQAGAPRALYESPLSAFAAAFMGEGSIVPGLRATQGAVHLGPLELPQRHPGPAGRVEVVVRPEAWRLRACSDPGLPGSVAQRRYLGKVFEYVVRTPLAPVLVHSTQTRLPLEVGAPVNLGLAPQGAWVLESS